MGKWVMVGGRIRAGRWGAVGEKSMALGNGNWEFWEMANGGLIIGGWSVGT